jgi:RHS repeat-associated protein
MTAVAAVGCTGDDREAPPRSQVHRASLEELAMPVAATLTGEIPGSFAVGDDGQATYTMPLELPAGRGMTPQLALSYRSRGGNSLVGVGWSLAGASSLVTRCSKIYGVEGRAQAITFTADDSLCWDGKRLVLTPGGTANVAERHYRTEIESHAHVVARDVDGSGPGSLRIWLHDGRILTYDVPVLAARHHPAGAGTATHAGVVYAWLLSRVEDRAGNFYTIEYEIGHDASAAADVRPRTIRYGGHTSGVPADRTVTFTYEQRPDPQTFYVGGFGLSLGHRLRRVEMSAPATAGAAATPLWRYELGYANRSVTQRSLLYWVQRCDGSQCLPHTQFDWQLGSVSLAPNPIVNPPVDRPERLRVADIDGDGDDDLVVHGWPAHTTQAELYRRDVRTCTNASSCLQHIGPVPGGPWTLADHDLDGRAELVFRDDHDLVIRPAWHGAPDLARLLGAAGGTTEVPPFVVDVDGDGRRDLALQAFNNAAIIFLSPHWRRAQMHGMPPNPVPHPGGGDAEPMTAVDIDGDGATELLLAGTAGGREQVAVVRTESEVAQRTAQVNLEGSRKDKLFLDINGDGLLDELSAAMMLRLNTGNGFTGAQPALAGAELQHGNPLRDLVATAGKRVRVLDWNRDGRQDLLRLDDQRVYLSDGAAFSSVVRLSTSNHGWSANPDSMEVGDFDGDGAPDLVYYDTAVHTVLWPHAGDTPDVIEAIHTGLGKRIRLGHGVSSRDSSQCSYPLACASKLPVVAWHEVDDGLPAPARVHHSFTSPVSEMRGRGFLGFHSRGSTEVGSGTVETRSFGPQVATSQGLSHDRQPLLWLPIEDQRCVATGGRVQVSRSSLRWTVTGDFPLTRRLSSTRVYTGDLEQCPLPLLPHNPAAAGDVIEDRTIEYDYHHWQVERVSETSSTGRVTVTTRRFEDRPESWLLGLVTEETVIDTAPSGESAQRRSGWRHDARGLVERNWSSASAVESSYMRDALGRIERRIDRAGGAARETRYGYDASGFLRTVTNPLGHVTTIEREPVRGLPVRITDPAGVSATVRHDPLGRPLEMTEPGSAPVSFQYLPGPSRRGSRVQSESSAGLRETVELDPAGRETARTWRQWDGEVQQQIRYDRNGLPARYSLPAAVGAEPQWMALLHDGLGRPESVTHPDGTVERWTYRGRSVRHVDRGSATHTAEYDQDGQLVRSLQSLGATEVATTYRWGPFGQLRAVTDAEGNVRETQYDAAGRPEQQSDPDRGTWQLAYDAWGQLAEAHGPVGTRRYTWDALGRPTEQHTEDGVTTFTWDTAFRGIGKLHQSVSPDGVRTVHRYDAAGRPEEVDVLAAGRWYRTSMSYDAAGRLAVLAYPAGPSGVPLRVHHRWRGDLLEALTDGSTGRTLWEAQSYAPSGLITQERLGNGIEVARTEDPRTLRIVRQTAGDVSGPLLDHAYQYTAFGDLSERRDELRGSWERARYDRLRRLERWVTSDGRGEGYHYSPGGRLTSVERWQAGHGSTEETYGYGVADAAGVRRLPGAVTSVNERRYQYDALGRQTEAPGRVVTYTAFDLPRTITSGARSAHFAYDAQERRVLTRGPEDVTLVTIGGLYEHRIASRDASFSCASRTPGAPCGSAPGSQHRATLFGPAGPVAEVRWIEGDDVPDVQYLHTDPQGTIIARSSDGLRLEERRFDPWGKPLGELGTSPEGYTGHRHEPAFGLIDMRGRFYDPALRRFLSPDPVVASLHDSQGQDPYAYVRNNPLTFTDPTGFISVDGNSSYIGQWQYIRQPDGQLVAYPTDGFSFAIEPETIIVYGNAPRARGTRWDAAIAAGPEPADPPPLRWRLPGPSPWDRAGGGHRISAGHDLPAAWQVTGTTSGDPSALVTVAADIVIRTVCVLAGCDNAWAPNEGTNTLPRRSFAEETLRYGTFVLGGLAGKLLVNALQPFKGQLLTEVGRALTKHPEVVGLTKNSLRNSLRTSGAINDAAAAALRDILERGARTTINLPRYGQTIQYQVPGGFGARWYTDGRFIGFISP